MGEGTAEWLRRRFGGPWLRWPVVKLMMRSKEFGGACACRLRGRIPDEVLEQHFLQALGHTSWACASCIAPRAPTTKSEHVRFSQPQLSTRRFVRPGGGAR